MKAPILGKGFFAYYRLGDRWQVMPGVYDTPEAAHATVRELWAGTQIIVREEVYTEDDMYCPL